MTKSTITIMYHGSPNELVGEKLNPSQGVDSEERPENNQFGVYATDRKDFAIVMGIFGCKDVIGGSIDEYHDGKLNATMYGDLPKQEYVYVYHLPIATFKQLKVDEHQFFSLVAVRPIKVEKVRVSDYKHLVRHASKEETKQWIKKYGSSKSV